ncbi:MAG: BppU family phage baseplate upper protein, partial [Ruminococcus sp.]|nr:BppU family phage baseplate upper protein [Ruminococcus sp.]
MNDYIAEITLDLNCVHSCQAIMLSEFDTGKMLRLRITADGAPYSVAGCSAVLKGVNSDGSGFAIPCEVAQDGTAVAVTDDITHAVPGIATAQAVISDSSKTFYTQHFLIYVNKAQESDITVDPHYSILDHLIRQVQLIDEHGGIIIDDVLDNGSRHPVENRVIAAALSGVYTFDVT